ncbi:sugar phosphate isomerase/epimerase [Caballeronia sp. BR00000012568055]|uniref:sugar phosphate isomerase/epimerase family protein n=1 Tax=Caballeronia sp. BR00000012568055 TaxID=2918761 RepID=UPI0023F81D18|nr:sugar phosphate isomerase/epimerase family protein [Caballeronia sp. BR00000012568055]
MRDLSQHPEFLAINTATLRQWPLERIIEACGRRGIRAIAPWHDDVERTGLARTRQLLRDWDVALCGYCRAGLFPVSSEAERAALSEHNRRVLDFARELEAPGVVIVAGGLPSSSRDLAGARAQVRDGVASLLDYAKTLSMPLAIEPLHPMYAADRACINTLEQALDLCDELDPARSGALGVAVDCYHVWWDPKLDAQIARAGRERIFACHLCDWLVPTRDMLNDRGMMGDGVIDIARLRGSIEATGFDGYLEVEIFSSADWWQRDGNEVLDTCMARYRTVV